MSSETKLYTWFRAFQEAELHNVPLWLEKWTLTPPFILYLNKLLGSEFIRDGSETAEYFHNNMYVMGMDKNREHVGKPTLFSSLAV